MKSTRPWRALAVLSLLPALLLALGACAPTEDAPGEPNTPASDDQQAATATTKADPEGLDLAETAAVFILPAPSEIAAAVEGEGGFDVRRVTADPLPSYDGLQSWQTSLTVGRVIADLLIAAPTAPVADLIGYLDNLQLGLTALGVDPEQIAQLRELRNAVADGAVGRDALIDRFDQMRVDVLREGKSQLGERSMALLATGGWARAVNLVSKHIQETDRVPAGSDALKLRLVVTTLIDRLGTGEDVQPVVDSLREILPLTEQRPSEPTPDELVTLIAETDHILSLARAS